MAMKLLFKKFLEGVLLLNKSCFTVTIRTYRIIPKLVTNSVHAVKIEGLFYIFYQEEYFTKMFHKIWKSLQKSLCGRLYF